MDAFCWAWCGAPEHKGGFALSSVKYKTIISQRTNSSGLEREQGEGDGEEQGEHGDRASTGGFSGTCDLRANFCCWLHTSGTISPTHACLPTASSAVLSASGGVRAALRRAAGIWSLLGERVICQAAGEPRGHCHAFVPPSLSFPPSDFFSLSASSCVCSAPPCFPPTVPVLIFLPLYKYVFLRLLLLPAQLPPSVLPS